MDEKLQAALAELINKANQGVDGAVSFMSAELPDVIHQLLVWYSVKSAIMFAIFIATLAAWAVAERWAVRVIKGSDASVDDIFILYVLAGSIARLIPILIAVCTFSTDWLQIWIAPKIWLIEYAASLAK